MRDTRKKGTKAIAVCGVLSSLSLAMMFLGTIIEVFDLTSAAVASFMIFIIVKMYGAKWAVSSFFATAVLSLFLFAGKFAPLAFLFVGFYPIVKHFSENTVSKKILQWAIKLSVFNASFYLLLHFGENFLFDAAFLHDKKVLAYVLGFAFGNLYIFLFDKACFKVYLKYSYVFNNFLR